jgi:hypothetical protein
MPHEKRRANNVIEVDFRPKLPEGPYGVEDLELLAIPFFMLFEEMVKTDEDCGGYAGPLHLIVERESLGLFDRNLSREDAYEALDDLKARGFIEWKKLIDNRVQVDFTEVLFDWVEAH